ncbi:MAG TPA: peroxiredoxin [Nevskiaceae bacterium]|nr:peroxiredoxin [Nevskiaceae bacterium]
MNPIRILVPALLAVALPAFAALQVGAKAPDFTTQASLAGKPFEFSLAGALAKGPVVLYFYPAAFTKGCTIEAHQFAEATDEFARLGATVIGISKDDIETLNKFSVSECRNKFAVAADPGLKIATSYDAKMPVVAYADRTSYVIAPDGSILYAYSAMKPDEHVKNTLAAVKAWRAAQPVPAS